jgi:hypothetical protein
MPTTLTPVEFALEDRIGNQPVTPETVDLPTLRAFLDEVETLIKGNVTGASITLAESRVRIEEGSLKVVALISTLLAADLESDLSQLRDSGDLDVIQPKRAEIIEQWQARARRMPYRSYSIGGRRQPKVKIASTSEFQHGGEKAWVSVEKYLTGKVYDIGGKQNPNVHVILSDSGNDMVIQATEQQLGGERENQLYKEVTLHVQAEQHLRTKVLRNIRLLEFLPQAADVDENALQLLWEKGREAWKDVDSPTDWLEKLRGNR